MPRVRPLEGREAGLLARLVQRIFRVAVGRELNPYKVTAYSNRVLLGSFLSNSVMTTGRWSLGRDLRHLARVRVAALNGCPF